VGAAAPTLAEAHNFEIVYDASANRVTIRQLDLEAERWWNAHQPQIAALMNGLAANSGGRMSVPLLHEIQERFAELVAETSGRPARVRLRTGIIVTRDPKALAAAAREGLARAAVAAQTHHPYRGN
jgi:hypothetical protein